MKQLSESDLANMVGTKFVPDERKTVRDVRAQLRLGQLIPKPKPAAPTHAILDFHGKTEDIAWDELNALIESGTRRATIITGASGILKPKFINWITDSTISKYILEYRELNRGSFEIKIKKQTDK